MKNKSIVIGIAGGSCSGKSSISKILANKLHTNSVTILHEKGYYKNKYQVPKLEEHAKNFDHPNVFNNYLLLKQLKELLAGKSVDEPYYSFKTHQQLKRKHLKHPAKVIILEGIMVLYDERLRHLMNIKAFVDADADIMLIRRLRRDTNEASTNLDYIFKHYEKTVRPMYKQFVLPTEHYADIIIPQDWKNGIAINALADRINQMLKNNSAK